MTNALLPEQLQASVLPASKLWSDVLVVAETGSTNQDLVTAARHGAAAGRVLVAERQTAGRGRLGRSWITAPGSALTFSVLLRPAAVPPVARGWLPLLTGVAVAAAIRAQTGLEVGLKWPNDVLAGSAKLAGILAEQAGQAIVVGTGINISAFPQDLASATATSLASLGAPGTDRGALLAAILREFERWYLRWSDDRWPGDAARSGLRAEYLRLSCTVGKDIRVELPGGASLAGRACGVDGLGRLLVQAADGVEAVSAGDVIHVR